MIDVAWAQAGGAGSQAPLVSFLLPIALIFGVFYFLLIRPQQKKTRTHQDMLKSLKVGDRVITTGGIYGTIVDGGEHSVKLEIADRVRVEVGRTYIAGKVGSKEIKEAK